MSDDDELVMMQCLNSSDDMRLVPPVIYFSLHLLAEVFCNFSPLRRHAGRD